MLERYLEKEVLRRLKITNSLWEKDSLTSFALATELNVSVATIKSDIKKINLQICDNIDPLIISEMRGYSILNKEKRLKKEYFRKILDTSLFLRALFFFLDSPIPEINILKEKEYISQAKAYSLKCNVLKYLEDIEIHIDGTILSQSEYRIRFLLAYYQFELGINIVELPISNKKLYCKLFQELENIERCMFSLKSKEYASILFQLTLERRNSNPLVLPEDQKVFFENTIIYKRVKETIKKFLNDILHFDAREEEVLYFALILNMMNANYYDDCPENFASYVELIQLSSNFRYEDLIEGMEKEFSVNLRNNEIFEAAITFFIRKCFFNLQNLIPEEHASLGLCPNIPPEFVSRVKKVLENWNCEAKLYFSFSCSHILQLASKVFFIVQRRKRLKEVYLLTSFHTDYLLGKEVLTHEFGGLINIKRFNPLNVAQSSQELLILYDMEYEILDEIPRQKLKIKYIFDRDELQKIRSKLFAYNLEDKS